MVRASFNQKPYRRVMMNAFGARYASPSNQTAAGRKILAEDPENQGALGIAISEAVEDSLESEKTGKKANYTIGSVFNHVCIHQTVAGLEAKKQLEMVEDYPDAVYGCIGGGSSFSGLMWPFYYDKVSKKAPKQTRYIAVEPSACPKVTRGYSPTTTATPPNSLRWCPCTLWDMTLCPRPSRQAAYATRHRTYHQRISQEKQIGTLARVTK